MSKLIEIEGDLLEAKDKYIAHQTNCIMKGHAGGLAKHIFYKYPWSDTYMNRMEESPFGEISIFGNGQDKRYVINMNAQRYPGQASHPVHAIYGRDSVNSREKAFKACLKQIQLIPDLESIAFPFQIGCGLAGGNWQVYKKMIEDFSDSTDAKVVIYRREGD